jgi:hypothetical protein
MKNFIQKNFTTIVLAIMILTFFKGCGDGRELTKIRQEIEEIKSTTYTKEQLDLRLQIEGLKSEHRMIQSTDRKIFDLNRQTQIEKEITDLETKLK